MVVVKSVERTIVEKMRRVFDCTYIRKLPRRVSSRWYTIKVQRKTLIQSLNLRCFCYEMSLIRIKSCNPPR